MNGAQNVVYGTKLEPYVDGGFLYGIADWLQRVSEHKPRPQREVLVVAGTAASSSVTEELSSSRGSAISSGQVQAADEPQVLVVPFAHQEEKWRRLVASRFPDSGKAERVRKALAALAEAQVDYGLDRETLRWIAEDKDLEDL